MKTPPPPKRPRSAIELLTPREMAEVDELSARETPLGVLMARAGGAVAQAALRLLDNGGTRCVVILCGPGNNGGDGFVAAKILAEAGCRVAVFAQLPRDRMQGEARDAAQLWPGSVSALSRASFEETDLVIDALFGAGLSREIEGDAREVILRTNAWARDSGNPLLAVDVASGIDGESGKVRGCAICATDCVTFFRLKPGHILMPGRSHCGSVTVADIGIDAKVLASVAPPARLNTPVLWGKALPVPSMSGHKYSRGHAVVVSGPLAQTGAARLAARAALRTGAGLVTVATPTGALPVHAAALTAIMTRVADDPHDLSEVLHDARKNVVVLGPGLGVGAGTRAFVRAALGSERVPRGPSRHVVLDADALTSFAEAPEELFEAIRASVHAAVLTPHDGEFAKLFAQQLDLDAAKQVRTARAAAISGAVVVLKGPDTVVAHHDGRIAITASEAPWLATAGSGDVLAGMIGGLLAQSMATFEAAAAAVWMHAEAARLFGPGLISEDIAEMMPRVLSALYEVT